jgi:hypothetical protein
MKTNIELGESVSKSVGDFVFCSVFRDGRGLVYISVGSSVGESVKNLLWRPINNLTILGVTL